MSWLTPYRRLANSLLFGAAKYSHVRRLANGLASTSSPVRPFILGIESSCDDTGAAVVDGEGRLLGEALNSQQEYSSRFGGVIPGFAQTLHEANIGPVVEKAMARSGLRYDDLDAIAVTRTPGMVVCLQVGVQHALDLCRKYRKPLIPIHHMQAHALTIRMPGAVDPPQSHQIEYPFMCLLVSGGHCILTWVKSVDEFIVFGHDIDGAPGEAFDKVARKLRLRHLKPEYGHLSGGVLIEKVAREGGGNPLAVSMPNPGSGRGLDADCNFSFSGIKTFLLQKIERLEREGGLDENGFLLNIADFCASFQHVIVRHIARRVERAFICVRHNQWHPEGSQRHLVVSGGVAANSYLRAGLAYAAAHHDYRLVSPPPRLCTDNGIMIAWNGLERFKAGIGVMPADDVPETMWVDAETPIGPDIDEGLIRKARNEAKRGKHRIKYNFSFYDPSHLVKALHYSDVRLQRRAQTGDDKNEAVGG